jgi:hypothetical protein
MHEPADDAIGRGSAVAGVEAERGAQHNPGRPERRGQQACLRVDALLAKVDAREGSGARPEDETERHAPEDEVQVVPGGRDALKVGDEEVHDDRDREQQVADGEPPAPELQEDGRHQDRVENVIDRIQCRLPVLRVPC